MKTETFNRWIKKYAKKALGILLIIGGVVGLFLPFFQGIAMIVAGLILLGNKSAIKKLHRIKKYLAGRWNAYVRRKDTK